MGDEIRNEDLHCTKSFRRRQFLATVGTGLILTLVGCGSPKPQDNASPTPPPTTAGAGGSGKNLRAALVLDTGGVDDKSFNAAAYAGLQRAQKELGLDKQNVKYVVSQNNSDYKTNLTQFASQGFDIVFAVGFNMEQPLKEVAPQFPNVKFAIVDGNAPDLPNCEALQFKEEQGTFLVGYLAAAMSKTKTIGFVGGLEIPLIKKFEAGYRAGAKTANPAVKVVSTYTGDWDDINKGKSQANQEFGNGADIIFHAAGKAGVGVIEAAKEKGPGFYAIGVDMDQDDVAPGRVLVSELKRLDNVVYDTIKRMSTGQFTPGKQVYDLKAGGVGISDMKYTRKDVPADVLSHLETIKQMIADGKIVPPTTLEAVATFQPPALK